MVLLKFQSKTRRPAQGGQPFVPRRATTPRLVEVELVYTQLVVSIHLCQPRERGDSRPIDVELFHKIRVECNVGDVILVVRRLEPILVRTFQQALGEIAPSLVVVGRTKRSRQEYPTARKRSYPVLCQNSAFLK